MSTRFFTIFPRASFAALLILAGAVAASAVTVVKDALPNKGIFGITVSGTDWEFFGRADHIVSISFQEYTTGALIVSEVNIDMRGTTSLLRIYSTRPVSLDDAAAQAGNAADVVREATGGLVSPPKLPSAPSQIARVDGAIQTGHKAATANLVVKTYPATTHAKTIEFAVTDRAELLTFYRYFRELFIGRPITVDANNSVGNGETANASGQPQQYNVTAIGGTHFLLQ